LIELEDTAHTVNDKLMLLKDYFIYINTTKSICNTNDILKLFKEVFQDVCCLTPKQILKFIDINEKKLILKDINISQLKNE